MKLATGSAVIDTLLDGGYECGSVTTIYGPAASGKTTACLLASAACANQGKKVLFIDTENGFSVERLQQLSPEYEKALKGIIRLRVTSFEDQIAKFRMLPELVKAATFGLIVVDTIGVHYRSARCPDYRRLNTELCCQIDTLASICKGTETAVLMTNQVYADVEQRDTVRPVGGDIITLRSKCLIQLRQVAGSRRVAILEGKQEVDSRQVRFDIVQNGFNVLP